MPSALAWLFNNDRDADLIVVITSKPKAPSSSIAGEDWAYADNTDTLSEDDIQPQNKPQETHVTRTLPGHKLVLNSYSDYFRASSDTRWKARDRSAAGMKRKHYEMEEVVPKVFLHVATPELVSLAEVMIRFMYTEELGERSIQELLKLVCLADEYGVVPLIIKCAEVLQDRQFETWQLEHKVQVTQLPASVLANKGVTELVLWLKAQLRSQFNDLVKVVFAKEADSSSTAEAGRENSSPSKEAALVDWLLADYLDLNAAFNDKVLRKHFLQWPFPAVDALLSRNDLQVPSENIVLVAAVSWLCSAAGGKAASPQDRVLLWNRVRLPQLQPCFIALLINAFGGTRKPVFSLPAAATQRLGCYLSSGQISRKRLQNEPLCRYWGTQRPGCPARGTLFAEVVMSDIEEAVQQLFDKPARQYSQSVAQGTGMFIDGLWCVPCFFVKRAEDDADSASLWAAIYCAAKLRKDDHSVEPLFNSPFQDESLVVRAGMIVHHQATKATWKSSAHAVAQVGKSFGMIVVALFPKIIKSSAVRDELQSALSPWQQDEGTVGPFEFEFHILPH